MQALIALAGDRMKLHRFVAGFAVLVFVALAHGEAPVTKEGKYWVQVVTGSASIEGATRLRISTPASLSLQGEARPDVAYSIKKRARADSEAHARQIFQQITLEKRRQDGWTWLEVKTPDRTSSAEIQARAPRGLREVALDAQFGSVDARDLDGKVSAGIGAGNVVLNRIQGDVFVTTGGGNVKLGAVGRAVRCVTGGGHITADVIGGDAQLNTGGGEISIREARGKVRASTGGGNIHVARAVGGVSASTGGGLIDVAQSEGPIVAETAAGSITIRSAKGVRCESGAGGIHLMNVAGGLRAATASGAITAVLSGSRLEDSALSTHNGDITVTLPSNVAVTVQAISDNPGLQKIVSDFPEIRLRPESRGSKAEAQGSLNGGGPVLKLSASNGTIYLRRQQ
jgi:DUF4097 and DUF4098 domain-containing protein YvlB